MANEASIALNRFGLGARPDEAIPHDPKAWLLQQFDAYQARPDALAGAPDSATMAAQLVDYFKDRRAARPQGGKPGFATPPAPPPSAAAGANPPMMAGATPAPPAAKAAFNPNDQAQQIKQMDARAIRQGYIASVGARTDAALRTPAPFVERMVHFWSNHFAVSTDKVELVGLAGPFEFEAIRPHVMGSFGDMLNAVEHHPAMLLYLDQAASIGPDSMFGARVAARGKRKVGINENLGREIMELHTLGVRTGYTQADVTEFARALTGWTVSGMGPNKQMGGPAGQFMFADRLHEPGVRTIMGKRYAQDGEAQGQAVLDMLAAHPATAMHIATKLARHFAGDTPPQPLVDRLRRAYLSSNGDLPTLYRVLIDSPEAWTAAAVKFRTPWEWSLSSYRAIGAKTVQPAMMTGLLDQLGQPLWKPGQPIGYDDIAASWAGPDAVMRRVEAAQRFGNRAGDAVDARALAAKLFPGSVSASTAQSVQRAESPGQALALLLASPEMMRR